MDKKVIYVGLDVDDTQYHGSALDKDTGEVITFQCRPTLAGLSRQLAKLERAFHDSTLNLCYEASYIGYTLQRDLVKHGYWWVRGQVYFSKLNELGDNFIVGINE